MASKTNIKGLVIEIGGDTTKLGKALEGVNKQSRDLSSELGNINKLLKLDPKNTELLAQKQKVLADAIATTKTKLDTLKKAEQQVQAQFEKGEASEEQVRALQREIIATTKKLDNYEKAAKDTANAVENLGKESDGTGDDLKDTEKGADKASDSLDEMAKSADKAGDSSEGLGSKLGGLVKGGLAAVAAAATAAIAGLVGSAEATREYRTEMGKLDAAFTTAGHTSGAATKTYKQLQSVLGETDQAVEAANHLAKLTDNEQDLEKWTNICTGVYATFGASLPIEGLTEAANETAKVGQVTGPLADALNWAGVNEDAFNESLAACSTEQERQTLIMETLNGLYTDAADKYREVNAEVIRANQANEEWTTTLAEIGSTVEPILTDFKLLGASLLGDLVPGIQQVAEGFRGMLNGDEGAAANMGAALSGIIEHLLSTLTNALPQVAEMAVGLISSMSETLAGMLPQLYSVGVELLRTLLSGISTAIPEVLSVVVDMIPELVKAFQNGLPLLLQGVLSAVTAIVTMLSEQLPVLLPLILDTVSQLITLLVNQAAVLLPEIFTLIVSLVTMLVNQLPILIPQIVSLVVGVVDLLAKQLPLLIPQLVSALISIVMLLVEQVPVIIPMLIEAVITIVMAIVEALPTILIALTDALPELLQAVWDAIVMVFDGLPQWYQQLFQGAWDAIAAIFGGLGEWFGSLWETVQEIWSMIPEWIGDIFATAWKNLKEFFSPEGVGAYFQSIWNAIKAAFSFVKTWYKEQFSAAWESVKKVFSGVGTFFSGVWDKIKNAFSSIGTKISDSISGAVKSGINGLLGSAENIINGFLRMINGAIDLINEIPGVSISKVDMVSFTRLAKGGVVTKATPAIFGEDGAEAVVPLEKNTEWIQRVAREFTAQVKNEAGASVLGDTTNRVSEAVAENGMLDKLDKILSAIERGQILTIDGKALVGATADMTDSALGQRRALVARGAV